jgi:hypothetical protein
VDERAQQRAVAEIGDGRVGRQPASHHEGEEEHQRRRDAEDGPPAERRAEEAARDAGREHADQQPAHHQPHHPAPLARPGEPRGEGDQELRYDRGRAHRETGGRQPAERRGERRAPQRGGDADQHHRHQLAPLPHVAERDEEEEPQRVADLRDGGDEACAALRHPEVARDLRQERLMVVEVGDGQPRQQREEPDGALRQRRPAAIGSAACADRPSDRVFQRVVLPGSWSREG